MSNFLNKTLGKLRFLGQVPYGVFLVLFVLSVGLSIYALRHNNQEMVKLRNAVYEADKNSGNIETTLKDLRSYVYGHMNSDLASGGNAIKPPIQLKYSYERLQTAEQTRVDEANSQIYTEAQDYCQAQNPSSFSGGPRVPCIEDYVTTHGVKANEVPAGVYKFDFISPFWSPDLAGWSLVASVVLFIAFAASFLLDRMVNSQMKSQQL